MKAHPTNAKGCVGQPESTNQNQCSDANFTDLLESIKTYLLAGRDIRLIDYSAEQRPFVVGIIAMLRDELPIRTGWQTVRESHLSETRLRARRYCIPGEFLREVNHD